MCDPGMELLNKCPLNEKHNVRIIFSEQREQYH